MVIDRDVAGKIHTLAPALPHELTILVFKVGTQKDWPEMPSHFPKCGNVGSKLTTIVQCLQ
jgi:hypothetical protein